MMDQLSLPGVYDERQVSCLQIVRSSSLPPRPPSCDKTSLLIDGLSFLGNLGLAERIDAINRIRAAISEYSPFRAEPVDCVQWVPSGSVFANDYNPNSVAPPEMLLLEHSIKADGYTQPIVTWIDDDRREVIDGFHRNRVGKESAEVRARVHGYLPVVTVNASRSDKGDRIAATIRHNRARGKHRVDAMSDIVVELKRRNWSDERIGKELGMDADEVLRLCQITGIAEVFADQDFSEAWSIGGDAGSLGAEMLSDVIHDFDAEDGNRIFHTWEKWECYKAGFYAERPPGGITQEAGEELYRAFLSDQTAFEAALRAVVREWKFSCEHYLTNDRMNRIAWLGQAAAAQSIGMPSCCRGGYHLLTEEQKNAADALALRYLNEWLESNGRESVTAEQAGGRTEAELY